jgi:hypothetical protein
MMDLPLCLHIDHRVGPPPATADVLGTWNLPGRGRLVAVMGDGITVACWWSRRPRRAWRRWYVRAVVPALHRTLKVRWGLGAGRSAHAFVAGTAATWQPVVEALNAARRRAQH